jgi:hypothetical protein
MEIIFKQVFVLPNTRGTSQEIFWSIFYPHAGLQFGPGGPMRGRGAFAIIFKRVCGPQDLWRKPGNFLDFFNPHVGPQFGPGGPMRGRGAFAIIFKHVFVVPKTSGETHLIFLNFFIPTFGMWG